MTSVIRPTTRSIMKYFRVGGILCFFACGNSTVLLLACFVPACGKTCCVFMQQSTWCPSLCFIIFSQQLPYSRCCLSPSLVHWRLEERGPLHVVIQLSCNSHAFMLRVERHVVSSCEKLHGFLNVSSLSQQSRVSAVACHHCFVEKFAVHCPTIGKHWRIVATLLHSIRLAVVSIANFQ
jgi:hypothetical protein